MSSSPSTRTDLLAFSSSSGPDICSSSSAPSRYVDRTSVLQPVFAKGAGSVVDALCVETLCPAALNVPNNTSRPIDFTLTLNIGPPVLAAADNFLDTLLTLSPQFSRTYF